MDIDEMIKLSYYDRLDHDGYQRLVENKIERLEDRSTAELVAGKYRLRITSVNDLAERDAMKALINSRYGQS